ncbi:MAG TPA: PDZ domain-containing protein [Gemmatimonadales bacterium]|nr:PDZ domain-containing protein [Gemmatimonadales bacterium]
MRRILTVLALALLPAPLLAQLDARLMQQPDVSTTQIAFVYAGDIWVVAKQGGVAARLTTPAGDESFPKFSPDGKWIAFTGDYDGNQDVYVMPVGGGIPTRLTWNPAPDRVVGWYPDGSGILFASTRESGSGRFDQLYKVSPTGGMATKLPVAYGEFGAVSPDGKTLAYMPEAQDFRTWKRYRGGWASDVWLFDLTTFASRNVTHDPALDGQPMWHGDTLYFLSDRDDAKRGNIWALDLKSNAMREVTHFTDFDVEFPSASRSDMVFEAGGRLYRMDLASEHVSEVPVQVVTDRATLKPRAIATAEWLTGGTISPTGQRAILEARGDLFSLPAKDGSVFDLTRTSGSAERWPSWSPDGKTVAYWSDRSGEYELTVRPADGTGTERTVTHLGAGFRYRPWWSPDGKSVAYIDQAMKIWITDIATGESKLVDQALYFFEGNLEGFTPSWSADSRWLAYARDLPSQHTAIFLYDTRSGKATQATAGFYSDNAPAFDPDGKYLYFTTNRTFTPVYSDFDNTWVYNNSTSLAAVPLRADVPSPLAPKNDVENADTTTSTPAAATGKGKSAKGAKADTKESTAPKAVDIDLTGFEQRIVLLPPDAGNFGAIAAASGKVVFQRPPRTGSDDKATALKYYDLADRTEKTVLADVDGFQLSQNGKKVLAWKGKNWAIVDLAPDQKLDKPLATADMQMVLDPPAEWRQIFNDAWRIERDFFYDPGMNGEDWDAMRTRYGAVLQDAVTRSDVNWVLGELIGEMNNSHTYRSGGDLDHPLRRPVGMLGCDFTLENGAYRITRIIRGAPWDVEVRSPLDQPGVNVKEGDYLLAVDHVPVDVTKEPWAALDGLAGKTVILTVNSAPSLTGAREVAVQPLASESQLRYLAWVDAHRRRVEEASGGKIGYIYVPSTGIDGQTELARMYWANFDKPGLIVDERFNSGGQIPDRFVEMLDRHVTSYYAVRDGMDWRWPPDAHNGPMAMLINGWSGSGGDAFPYYFRERKLGPLIGMRTWGGLVGISGTPGLVDGGAVTAPTFGIYDVNGQWTVEGHGVDPDIEVVDDPTQLAKGTDPQLERAIQEVMQSLKDHPPVTPKKPAYIKKGGQ